MSLISSGSHGIEHELSGRSDSTGKTAAAHAESHRMEQNAEMRVWVITSGSFSHHFSSHTLSLSKEGLGERTAFVNAALLAMSGHSTHISKPLQAQVNKSFTSPQTELQEKHLL